MPSSRTRRLLFVPSLAAAAALIVRAHGQTITPVGSLYGFASHVYAVNGDGTVTVGHCNGWLTRWTDPAHEGRGTERIQTTGSSGGYGLNRDGSVIVGATGESGTTEFAWRYTDTGGFMRLGALPGQLTSHALSVSAAGDVVIGFFQRDSHRDGAFRWTVRDGTIDIGTLPGDDQAISGGISGDGRVIAGLSWSSEARHVFRWTAAEGMRQLPHPPIWDQPSAGSLSDDGSVICGSLYSSSTFEGHMARWKADGSFTDLGGFRNGTAATLGVSPDGSVLVGRGHTNVTGDRAVLWTSPTGVVDLAALLESRGVNLEGWLLREAYAVSPDRRHIIGNGFLSSTGGNSIQRGWLVSLPDPIVCPADVDDGSGTGTPDGAVASDDLLYFLALYSAGALGADLDDGQNSGVPDGGVGIDDLLYFLDRYRGGC